MAEYIDRKAALSFPFANGEYDHENANEHFIYGCETYKEWLEQLPKQYVVKVVNIVRCEQCEYAEHAIQTTRDYRVFCCKFGEYMSKDDFCSRGVRIDGVQNE